MVRPRHAILIYDMSCRLDRWRPSRRHVIILNIVAFTAFCICAANMSQNWYSLSAIYLCVELSRKLRSWNAPWPCSTRGWNAYSITRFLSICHCADDMVVYTGLDYTHTSKHTFLRVILFHWAWSSLHKGHHSSEHVVAFRQIVIAMHRILRVITKNAARTFIFQEILLHHMFYIQFGTHDKHGFLISAQWHLRQINRKLTFAMKSFLIHEINGLYFDPDFIAFLLKTSEI